MGNEIKPCPFCGGDKNTICKTDYNGRDAYAVSCRYHNCHGSIFTLGYGYFSTKDQAIAAWNTRALPAAPQTGGWGGVAENVRTGGWGGITALPAAPMGVKPRVKCDWPHCRCHPALCEAPPQPLYTGAFSAPQPAPTLGDALELLASHVANMGQEEFFKFAHAMDKAMEPHDPKLCARDLRAALAALTGGA